MAIDPARGPADFDRLDAGRGAETEVEPTVAGGKETAPPQARDDPPPPVHDDRHLRPDRVAVGMGTGPLKLEGQVRAGGALVVEVDQRGAVRDDQDVDLAVVVKIADRKPPAQARNRPGRAGQGRDVAQPPPPSPRSSIEGMA